MKKAKLLDEEVIHYLKDEWNDSFKEHENGIWLTTRAIRVRLEKRGILTSWQTINIKLHCLLMSRKVEMIKTSSGECWKPADDTFKI